MNLIDLKFVSYGLISGSKQHGGSSRLLDRNQPSNPHLQLREKEINQMNSLNLISSGLDSSKLLSAQSKEINTKDMKESTLQSHQDAGQNITILQENRQGQPSTQGGKATHLTELEFFTQDFEAKPSAEHGVENQSMSFSNELIQDNIKKQASAGETRSRADSASRLEKASGIVNDEEARSQNIRVETSSQRLQEKRGPSAARSGRENDRAATCTSKDQKKSIVISKMASSEVTSGGETKLNGQPPKNVQDTSSNEAVNEGTRQTIKIKTVE